MNTDGSIEKTAVAGGPAYELRRDDSGLPLSLWRDGVQTWKASWQQGGKLGVLLVANTEIRLSRENDGRISRLLISEPMEGGKTDRWLREEWDRLGQIRRITDSSGFEYAIHYDAEGRISSFGRVRKDGKLAGAGYVYDNDGRVSRIDSSWDTEKREHAADGRLKRVEIQRRDAKSAVVFDAEGRQAQRQAFDGGITTWLYDSDREVAHVSAIELPNGGRVDYRWSNDADASTVQVGLGPAVVKTQTDASGRMVAITWGKRSH